MQNDRIIAYPGQAAPGGFTSAEFTPAAKMVALISIIPVSKKFLNMRILPVNFVAGNFAVHLGVDVECEQLLRIGQADAFHFGDFGKCCHLIAKPIRAGLARPEKNLLHAGVVFAESEEDHGMTVAGLPTDVEKIARAKLVRFDLRPGAAAVLHQGVMRAEAIVVPVAPAFSHRRSRRPPFGSCMRIASSRSGEIWLAGQDQIQTFNKRGVTRTGAIAGRSRRGEQRMIEKFQLISDG